MHRRRPPLSGRAAPVGYAALLLGAGMALLAAAPDARAQDGEGAVGATTLDGVYTAGQAERGREIFAESCEECHDTDRFTGDAFRPSWSRAPASTLFTVIRSQMPFDNPGSLDRDEYAAVIAYLLELNDLPAGDRELPASADSLRDITIRFPPSSDGSSDGGGSGSSRDPNP